MQLPWIPDVTVVGGGLTGLAAAVALTRAHRGLRVALLDKGTLRGGRGVTQREDGFHLNLGPHALFSRGPAERLLTRLGVRWHSGNPASFPNMLRDGGALYPLPNSGSALLGTSYLSWKEKWAAGRFFATLARRETASLDGVSVGDWLPGAFPTPRLCALVETLLCVGSYTHAPEQLSAGAALTQLQAALPGVRYVDGGWQTLVDGLTHLAEQAGVRFLARAKVVKVEHDGAVRAVQLGSGERLETHAALLCVGPREAAAMTGVVSLERFAALAKPVRMATLDVALRALPRARPTVCFPLDAPLYYSVHSAVAALAPPGGAVLHVARYLHPDATDADPTEQRAELERFLDSLQPGWRDSLVHARFMPHLPVMHAAALAAQGGLRARPPAAVSEVKGLAVAGDWVGPEGMLLDACLASVQQAVAALRVRAAH